MVVKDVADVAGEVVTTLALLVGGVFAYFKFVRGRVLHASCAIDLAVDVVGVWDATALLVRITIVNDGGILVRFPHASSQRIDVLCMDRVMWDEARESGNVLWAAGVPATAEIMTERERGNDLEPGSRSRADLVIPIPAGEWGAFSLTAVVEGSASNAVGAQVPWTWTTHTIAMGAAHV